MCTCVNITVGEKSAKIKLILILVCGSSGFLKPFNCLIINVGGILLSLQNLFGFKN